MTKTMPEGNSWSLYYLICPIENIVRYVGISTKPRRRFREHLICKTNKHKYNWIQILNSKGLKPKQKIIETQLSKEAALKLEKKHGLEFHEQLGRKFLNDLAALGQAPPRTIGCKNPAAKKKSFKVWNDSGEEYFFNYQFEVEPILGKTVRNNMYRILNGSRRSIKGYYACYLTNLKEWKPPSSGKGKENYFAKKRPFKVWNTDGEEYFFDYQFQAIEKLALSQRHLSKTLLKKQKTLNGYYICYVDELKNWSPPKDNRIGERCNLSKRKPFILIDQSSKRKYKFNYQFEAVKKFNLSSSSLSMLLNKKLKTCEGYEGYYL